MNKLFVLLASAALSMSAASAAFAGVDAARIKSAPVLFAQEDCQAGETWNEETKKCEKAEEGKAN